MIAGVTGSIIRRAALRQWARHSRSGQKTKDQWRHAQRARPTMPRYVLESKGDVPQAEHLVLGLPDWPHFLQRSNSPSASPPRTTHRPLSL